MRGSLIMRMLVLGFAALLTLSATSGRAVAAPEQDVPREPRTAVVQVDMRGQRFVPARLVVAAGDSVRFKLESGGPHNIAFDADSLPAGALAPLARTLKAQPSLLFSPYMLLTPGETYVLSTAGLPPGRYPFYCAPHIGGGMRGEFVIEAR